MIFPFLKYKQQKEPCIAHGPTMNRAHRWGADFKHSPFSIELPDSNERLYEPDRSPSPSRVGFGWYDYETVDSIKRWCSQGFLTTEYRFWGPRGWLCHEVVQKRARR